MRKWILLIVVVVGMVSGVQAQDEPDTPIYLVALQNCELPWSGVVEQAQINIAPYGYHFISTTWEYGDDFEPDDIYLWFKECLINDTVYLFLCSALNVSPMENLSPALISYPIGCGAIASAAFSHDSLDGIEFSVNYLTAVSLYAMNRCDEAVPYLEQAQESIATLNFDPYRVLAPFLVAFHRANCALQNGDYQRAIELYESVLVEFPPPFFDLDTLPAAINLAWAYLQIGEEDKAIALIDKAVSSYRYWLAKAESSGNSFPVIIRRAHLYALASRYDDAVADVTAAIELDPENPELYVLRGQMYLYLYEWDSVLNDYNTAIELDPAYPDAYFYRGILYYSILQTGQELRPEALADFQYYLELAPEGRHAAEAARYAATIQAELDALDGE